MVRVMHSKQKILHNNIRLEKNPGWEKEEEKKGKESVKEEEQNKNKKKKNRYIFI